MIAYVVLGACFAYLFLAFIDLARLRGKLRELSKNKSGSVSVSPKFLTLFGRKAFRDLDALRLKCRTLEWSAEHASIEAPSLPQRVEISGHSNSQESYFLEVLNSVRERFRADTGVIAVVVPGEAESSRQIYLPRELKAKLPLKRFEQVIWNLFDSYFRSNDRRTIGIIDGDHPPTLSADFRPFGYKHVLSESFEISSGDHKDMRGVFCFFYRHDSAPLLAEQMTLRGICRKLESDIVSTGKLIELSGKVTEAGIRNKHRSEFLAHVSHDIRSPLNNVRAILNLLRDEELSIEMSELLGAAVANCSQVSEIVDDLLDYSKHQAGKLEPRCEHVEIYSAAKEMVLLHQVAAKLKGLTLSFDDDNLNGRIFIKCDRRHFKRVLGNLINNAVKYTRHGLIHLGLSVDDEHAVELRVRDTGIGMSKEQLDLLFTPFTRFHSSEAEGVGLGLSLSRILVELNGGEISVHSDIGNGSEFVLRFPIAHMEILRAEPKAVAVSAARIPINVLVVDDDAENVDSLARNLERSGYGVLRCYSVSQAAELVQSNHIDFVVTDYNMPGGGAPALIEIVNAKYPEAGVVILSGKRVTNVEALLSQHTSVISFLEKPCEVREIERVIEDWRITSLVA